MARVRAPTKQLRDSAAEILKTIHRDPYDLGARLVYADLLQELGDPRGEYIAIQLDRPKDRKPRERERELETLYRKTWLGGLDVAFSTKSRFQNGFLYVVVTKPHRNALDVDALANPELVTVEILDTHGLGTERRLVGDPSRLVARMPNLRELVIDANCIEPLRDVDVPITSLGVFLPGVDALLALLAAKRMKRLRALRVWNSDPGADVLVRLASAVPLESFGCFLDTDYAERAAISIGKLVPAVDKLTITVGWGKAQVARDGDDLVMTIHEISRTMSHEVSSPLRKLVDALGRERVRLVFPDSNHADIAKQLAKAGYRARR